MDQTLDQLKSILAAFSLSASDFQTTRIGTGHIHQTYKLSPPLAPSLRDGVGGGAFILQRVNNQVFKQPEIIASNIRIAAEYLKKNFPSYLFLSALPARDGTELVYDTEGFPWRLFPYQANTITLDRASTQEEAFNAAAGFAALTARLNKIDVLLFRETIPRFHDLAMRYQQFEAALTACTEEKRTNAKAEIQKAQQFSGLVTEYSDLVSSGTLRLRITHNDTKINNILFDATARTVVCVIDLDTLMPGYFIYDLGDMVRTFVSPVTEEEKDFSRIIFRNEMYQAVLAGYLSEMDSVLTMEEKRAIPFAGKMMTYIMALRFLADYLNGDIYYHTTYPGQNLVRAGNQLRLVEVLMRKLAGKLKNIKH